MVNPAKKQNKNDRPAAVRSNVFTHAISYYALTLYYKVSFVNRDTQVHHKPLNFLCTTARDFVAIR
jgi:hypothetical protein